MRANGNFSDVTASQGSRGLLPAGGYACFIQAIIDGTEETSPYLDLVLNVLDPKTKKLMSTTEELLDPEQNWRSTYRYWVSAYDAPGIDWARYKALVEAVEQTAQNKGFVYQDVDGGEQQLAGKWVGCVFRHYLKVNKKGKHAGEQTEGVELSFVLPAADAIAGNFNQRYLNTRDARPKELRGTPFPPEQQVVKAPPAPAPQPVAPAPATAPAQAAPAAVAAPQPPQPDLYDEELPF